MSRFDDKVFIPLDEEEAVLMASLENEEWFSTADPQTEKEKAVRAARHTIKNDKRRSNHPEDFTAL